MSNYLPIRPKVTRPLLRDVKASYFQMHVLDQERKRLEAERAEIVKRLSSIQERIQTIVSELTRLEVELKHFSLVETDQ